MGSISINSLQDLTTIWDTKRIAEFFNVLPATVRAWRWMEKGPPWHRIGRAAIYLPDEVIAWVRDHPPTKVSASYARNRGDSGQFEPQK